MEHIASNKWHTLELYINDADKSIDELFIDACYNNDIELVHELYNYCMHTNVYDITNIYDIDTIFIDSSIEGHNQILQFLHENYKINRESLCDAFYWAIVTNNITIAKYLIKNTNDDLDINNINDDDILFYYQNMIIEYIPKIEYTKMCKLLVKNLLINATFGYRTQYINLLNKILFYACLNSNHDMMNYLCDKVNNTYYSTNIKYIDKSILYAAVKSDSIETLKYICDKDVYFDIKSTNDIINDSSIFMLIYYLERYIATNKKDVIDKMTHNRLLNRVIHDGNLDVLNKLHELGLDIMNNEQGLIIAASHCNYEIMNYYINSGVSLMDTITNCDDTCVRETLSDMLNNNISKIKRAY